MKRAKAPVREQGQALILIVLAVAGLLGLTALAVDGSHVFAQRRQAQNAADTAAFAAAIEKIKATAPGDNWSQALNRAAGNNFSDDSLPNYAAAFGPNPGQAVDVIILNPPDSTAPAAYVGNSQYVQVKINANIGTFFAKVIGVNSLPIHVQAVAKAIPAQPDTVLGNNGIVALGNECDAIKIHGGGGSPLSLNMTGGGLFSNSGSPASGHGGCFAVDVTGGANVQVPGITAVGCVDPADYPSGGLQSGTTPVCGSAPRPYPYPVPSNLVGICDSVAAGSKTGDTATPGSYTGTFPPGSRTTHLQPGLYCINGRFLVGSTDRVDMTGPGGVTFVVFGGSQQTAIQWSAGAHITLDRPTSGALAGLLIYVPYTDQSLCSIYPGTPSSPPCHTISLVGNADSDWHGTIFAPDSLCKIEGDNTTVAIDAQAICYTVDIGGGGNWTLSYTGGSGFPFNLPPVTELNR